MFFYFETDLIFSIFEIMFHILLNTPAASYFEFRTENTCPKYLIEGIEKKY